jgi:hypothetical protein
MCLKLEVDDLGVHLGQLPSLTKLGLSSLPVGPTLGGLENAPLLDDLFISSCSKIQDLGSLGKSRSLRKVLVSSCVAASVRGIEAAPKLEQIKFEGCTTAEADKEWLQRNAKLLVNHGVQRA